jgi:hypothetical protein
MFIYIYICIFIYIWVNTYTYIYITTCINVQKMQISFRIHVYGDKREYIYVLNHVYIWVRGTCLNHIYLLSIHHMYKYLWIIYIYISKYWKSFLCGCKEGNALIILYLRWVVSIHQSLSPVHPSTADLYISNYWKSFLCGCKNG